MEYIEFEKNIKDKLSKDQIHFDVKQFMIDINLDESKKRSSLWLVGLLLLIFMVLGYCAFTTHSDTLTSVTNTDVAVENMSLVINTQNKGIDLSEYSELYHSDMDNIVEPKVSDEITKGKANKNNSNPILKNVASGLMFTNEEKVIKKDVKIPIQTVADKEEKIIALEQKGLSNDVEQSANGLVIGNNHKRDIVELINIAQIETQSIQSENSNKTMLMKPQIGCPDFKGSDPNSGLEIIAEVGVFKPLKSLSNTTSEIDIITGLRQENEVSKVGLHAGLFLKYRLTRSPFYIFGGVDYSRAVEKMSLDYEVVERDTTIGVVSVTQSQAGDTITYIYGEIYNETTRTGNKTRHYTVSTIDIPLHLGYEWNYNKISAGAELGVALNIKSMVSGNFISSASEFVDVEQSNYFKDRLGIRFDTRLVFGYRINAFGKIYTSLSFNSYPNSISIAESGVNHRYHQVGLNLGYGMRF